jgi:hypothetical protein
MRINLAISLCLAAAFAAMLWTAMARGAGEPLELRIDEPLSADREAYVSLHVRMTNVSTQTLTLVETNPGCDFAAEVKDGNGQNVALTQIGEELHDCQKRTLQGRRIVITLKPGESAEDTYPVDLYYRFDRAGTYTVKLSRELPKNAGGGVVRSNVVTLVLDR